MVAEFSKDEPFKKLEVFRPHVEEKSPSSSPAQPKEAQLQQKDEAPHKKCRFKVLTRRKTTPKEHVEEVLGGDVGLEATVEVGVAVSVAGGVEFLVSELLVLLPLLRVAQHRVRVPDGCHRDTRKQLAPSSRLQPCTLPAFAFLLVQSKRFAYPRLCSRYLAHGSGKSRQEETTLREKFLNEFK